MSAPKTLLEAARTLRQLARQAHGRLPDRVQVAVELVDAADERPAGDLLAAALALRQFVRDQLKSEAAFAAAAFVDAASRAAVAFQLGLSLGGTGAREVLLKQAGALEDDETMPELLARVYERRGCPEADGGLESSETFHSHLDQCERCRTQVFNLCSRGGALLKGEAEAAGALFK